jgi:hypothetical protein
VRRRAVEAQLLDEPGQAGRLAFRQVEDESRQSGGVDDRVLERALQPAADEPGVERIVAVLDEHGALRETQEAAPGVFEFRRPDQHRAIDAVPLAGVGVDGRPAVDQRVEEGERARQREPLGADLEDEERRVARRLDVEGYELGVVERGLRTNLGSVDRDLLPCDHCGRPARLEVQGTGAHRAMARARRAQAISSLFSARSSSTATP